MAFDSSNLDDYVDVATRLADLKEIWPEASLRPWDPAEPWKLIQVQCEWCRQCIGRRQVKEGKNGPWRQCPRCGGTGLRSEGEPCLDTFVVVVAACYRNALDENPGIGMAWEPYPGQTSYTAGSELMNAETSAWGRAILAVLASDSRRGVASREEVRNRAAEREEEPAPRRAPNVMDAGSSSDRALRGPDNTTEVPGSTPGPHPSPRRAATGPTASSGAGPAEAGLTPGAGPSAAGTPRRVATAHTDPEHVRLRRGDLPGDVAGAEGRVDGSVRLAAVPPDDQWYDAPGQPLAAPEDRAGTITPDQLKAMHAAFSTLGVKDRDPRMALTAEIVGRKVPSSTSLSYAEGQRLLAGLHERAKAPADAS